MENPEVKQKLTEACRAIELDLEFYQVSSLGKGNLWRIVICKADGGRANMGDCAAAHRHILGVMQVADLYGEYDQIEVSSASDDPGAWD